MAQSITEQDAVFLRAAIDEALKGEAEGGIPIGSVLVEDGKIIGRGHNRRIQKVIRSNVCCDHVIVVMMRLMSDDDGDPDDDHYHHSHYRNLNLMLSPPLGLSHPPW